MKILSPALRRQLEQTVSAARDTAETGAQAALKTLAVHHHESYAQMSLEQRELRRRLRAHARQLGDRRNPQSGEQEIDHLVHECAYEHWHGMLFARFLAENELLIEPDLGISVTLEECKALAKSEGIDQWALAARFAHRMLPEVFRPDHPVFEVQLALEHRLKLERLVEVLPPEVFRTKDALGWVYQFWQSQKKDEVNRSEVKIGADELPAVTQLFTEPYMVSFLLDNTLGAWWAARRLALAQAGDALTEADLRQQVAIPGAPLDYLRFVRDIDSAEPKPWLPAAGAFDGWPKHPGELRVLDPCCGSGHFLVAALLMLVPMRMEEEELNARDAIDAVLRENLYGLELDPRCVQIAAFALALAAWTYPGAGGYRPLPELNVACSGLSVGVAKDRWTELAADKHNLRLALSWMHGAFKDAPMLGSLLDPAAMDATRLVDREELSDVLVQALGREPSIEQREAVVTAQGIAKAADLLSRQYHLVITNVPYLARGKQDDKLRAFCERYYATAKNDLATVFLERCLRLCAEGGAASLVLPQNWLFLTSYRKLREKLLKTETWHLLARLGPGAFETISGEVVKAILLTLSRGTPADYSGGLFGDASTACAIHGLDVSEAHTTVEKAARLREAEITGIAQARQLQNPDARVVLRELVENSLLKARALSIQGLATSDDPQFTMVFWEQSSIRNGWVRLRGTVKSNILYGGCERLLHWDGGSSRYYMHAMALKKEGRLGGWKSGTEARGREGIIISQMRQTPVSLFCGEFYDHNACVVVPQAEDELAAMWCYLSDVSFNNEVRLLDQSLKPSNNTFLTVPFDLDHWTRIANENYPHGLPRPYSNDPTQWIFHGHPCGSVIWDEIKKRTTHGPIRTDSLVLQVAVARLLGYRWPAEQDADMDLADEQRAWTRLCEALLNFADEDGIVCIPSVRGEASAEERLLHLLAAAFGDDWNNGILAKLLAEAGSSNLDDWLRNRFFEQHCKLFHERPFIWHIWDGRKHDGFNALVNCHKLAEGNGKGRRLLESLTYSYLGNWIARQEDSVRRGEGGAEDRLVAAQALQQRLKAILNGEPPFDIFIRWKPLKEQPIGWEPDINDGVRMNIRPFMAEGIPNGKRGAGVLRTRPNIKWNKDRGKEPFRKQEQFPWFWKNGEFTGTRVNDVHLTIAEKQQTREDTGDQS